ncbi:OLC1v1027423C1 [Oldenlandia corymbosa var. corymbosa]|uniref:OLC1v1027423C1 n=1 Tax=Oldenlandia corymbosa var. corymbosa TaxID=529605 RepID=A0AAV1CCG6_OLDCO|nr:OLC1v1027423C1 [Oldenlandia corymbosa var. corymbosa]
MALSSSSTTMLYISAVIIALCLCVRGALGNVVCEELSKQSCAYAVSSSGKRCVLENKHVDRKMKEEEYTCRTSEIEAGDRFKGWIETDECVQSCGLDRNALGISSDSLLDSQFTRKLCSPPCFRGCPNVADLYFSVAVGEGMY